MRPRSIGVLAVAALVAGAVDCRQIGGIYVLTGANAECESCADSQCASEEAACRAADATCGARVACELACDPEDAACRATCAAAPVGEAMGVVDGCVETTCGPACASQCGDVLPIVPLGSAPACAACIAQSCCAEGTACGTNEECRAGLECARAASVPDVVGTCTAMKHAGGATAFAALAACVQGSCGDACAFGADWSCLGAVQAPIVTADSIQSTLTLVDANVQSRGVPGLSVRACGSFDEPCANPVTPAATTDANGVVSLSLPTSAQLGRQGFIGYFEITDPAGVYITTIAIPGFDLTQPGSAQTLIVAQVSEAKALAAALGKTFDPTTGSVIVSALDCVAHPSEGATFAIDNGDARTIIAYPVDGIPSLLTTHTDPTGTGVIGPVAPGPGVLTVRNASGQVVSKTSYFTRADAVTVMLAPVNQ